jgi:hypothetical protein
MRLIMVLLVLLLSGCQAKPKPFVLGDEVSPPSGCIEARERGIEC